MGGFTAEAPMHQYGIFNCKNPSTVENHFAIESR